MALVTVATCIWRVPHAWGALKHTMIVHGPRNHDIIVRVPGMAAKHYSFPLNDGFTSVVCPALVVSCADDTAPVLHGMKSEITFTLPCVLLYTN